MTARLRSRSTIATSTFSSRARSPKASPSFTHPGRCRGGCHQLALAAAAGCPAMLRGAGQRADPLGVGLGLFGLGPAGLRGQRALPRASSARAWLGSRACSRSRSAHTLGLPRADGGRAARLAVDALLPARRGVVRRRTRALLGALAAGAALAADAPGRRARQRPDRQRAVLRRRAKARVRRALFGFSGRALARLRVVHGARDANHDAREMATVQPVPRRTRVASSGFLQSETVLVDAARWPICGAPRTCPSTASSSLGFRCRR